MACFQPLDYNVRFESYKRFEPNIKRFGLYKSKEEPSPIRMGYLEIRLRPRYQLKVLQTSTDDSKDEKLFTLEDIVYPELVKVLDFPRYVLASPKYMKLDIVDTLESLKLDSYLCDSLSPMMESFVTAASTSFGAENFVVIAHVEVLKMEVIGEETAAHLYMDSESEADEKTRVKRRRNREEEDKMEEKTSAKRRRRRRR
ncbi:hypothetical protein ACB092_05G276200 [Castanea dentata]